MHSFSMIYTTTTHERAPLHINFDERTRRNPSGLGRNPRDSLCDACEREDQTQHAGHDTCGIFVLRRSAGLRYPLVATSELRVTIVLS